jgi:hypothetical protein
MDHSVISLRELSNLTWSQMSESQRNIVTDAVLKCYFKEHDNSSSRIASLLNLKNSVTHSVITKAIVHGADLKALKKKYNP